MFVSLNGAHPVTRICFYEFHLNVHFLYISVSLAVLQTIEVI